MRWLIPVIALFLLAAVAGGGLALRGPGRSKDADFTRQKLAFLEQENGRLTASLARLQRAQENADDAQRRSEIEKNVTKLRGLPFIQPITYREIPRSDLPAILRQKLFQQVPEHELDDSGIALTALGLLPAGTDLQKTYLALLGEQVGAFYDQHTREVFTFSGQPLSKVQNRVILAHELTHALEDQHFHLANLPLEAKGNDDRAMAASALVEGDATLVMNRYMLGNLSGTALKDSLASALTTDVRQLAAAPRFLRETLLFPYLKGQVFCQKLYDSGGWQALAEAFVNPPSCTAQILHPERFLAQPRQEPVIVEFHIASVGDRKPLVDNVLGEFGIRQLLQRWRHDEQADDMAANWLGDRYLLFGDAKANSYVWRSVWSSEPAAQQFAVAAVTAWRTRPAAESGALQGDPAQAGTGEHALWSARLADGRELRIFRNHREVTLLEAQDFSWLATLTPSVAATEGNRP